MEKEDSSIHTKPSAPVLPISVEYPTHDPTLAEFSALISQNLHEPVTTIDIEVPYSSSGVQDAVDDTPTEIPPSPVSFWASCLRNWRWIMSLWIARRVFETFESSDSQNEHESTSVTTDNPDRDPRSLTGDEQVTRGIICDVGENLPEFTTNGEEELVEHHPSIESESHYNQNERESATLAIHITDDDPSILTRDEQHAMSFIGHVGENLPESTTNGEEEELVQHHPPIESESPYTQNEHELASLTIHITGHDPSILTKDEKHTTRVHDYSDPKDVKYLLRLYEVLLVLMAMKFILEKHNPLADLILKISAAFFALAYIIHIILCGIYERLENSNPSEKKLSPRQYKILKYVCYVLCILALLLLLPVFLTSNPNPRPRTKPSSPPSPPLGV